MSSEGGPAADIVERDFLGARLWRQDGVLHIDVGHLPPPDPFVAVLRLIESPDVDDEIVFLNDRAPLHLFPELVERGWSYRPEIDRDGEYRMRLIRESPR